MSDLYVKVAHITEEMLDFNGYLYRLVGCQARIDEPFDTLIPAEVNVSEGDIIHTSKCKIVRIDPDADYDRIAIRMDQCDVCAPDQELSKYYDVPYVGMVKKNEDAHPITYGPDKTKFFKIPIQLKDPDKKTFIVSLLAFGNNTAILDSYPRFTIITGIATLKHKKGSERYELAMKTAEPLE